MVYIYRKVIGGRPYYYLRASIRRGAKVVTKDIAYLGSTISDVKVNLGNLNLYKDKVRKAYKSISRFLESNHFLEKVNFLKLKSDPFIDELLPSVEACHLHYSTTFQNLDEHTKKEIFKNFVVEFAFNTASIEGNTITLLEARNFLQEGLSPANKTLREIYDIQNTDKTFFYLLHQKEELSHDFIVEVHRILMDGIDVRTGYRTMDIHVINSHFKASPAPYIRSDMDLLLKWYKENTSKLHPLVLAVIFHHKFERIHPFMDGNGRTGRMLMNYILMKHNYPPLIIHKKSRHEYLEALKKADKSQPFETKTDHYKVIVYFAANEMNSYWDLFL